MVLYRAVGDAELEQIRQTGAFENSKGNEVKYFALTEQGAQREAEGMQNFKDPPVMIVTAVIDANIVPTLDMQILDGVPSIVVETKELENFEVGKKELPLDTERAW